MSKVLQTRVILFDRLLKQGILHGSTNKVLTATASSSMPSYWVVDWKFIGQGEILVSLHYILNSSRDGSRLAYVRYGNSFFFFNFTFFMPRVQVY